MLLDIVWLTLGIFGMCLGFAVLRYLGDQALAGFGRMLLKPKPCARCGSSRLSIVCPEVEEHSSRFAVTCKACGFEGFTEGNSYAAIHSWNNFRRS